MVILFSSFLMGLALVLYPLRICRVRKGLYSCKITLYGHCYDPAICYTETHPRHAGKQEGNPAFANQTITDFLPAQSADCMLEAK